MALALESARLLTWRAAMLKDNKKPFTKVPVGKGLLRCGRELWCAEGEVWLGFQFLGPVGLLPQGEALQ